MRIACIGLALAACAPKAPPPEPLILEAFRPLVGEQIHLNEPLELTFSAELDLTTVTGQSLQVLRPDGSVAEGEWEVRGRWVKFWPKPVVASDLTGGGYVLGGEHRVRVLGFPALGGLRSIGGGWLERTGWRRFLVEEPEPDEVAFMDFSPYECAPVAFGDPYSANRARVYGEDPLRLTCAEPLDPRSLVSSDFRIKRLDHKNPGYVNVRAILVQNRHSERVGQYQPACEIELWPEEPLTEGDRFGFELEVLAGASLMDYSKHKAWPGNPTGEILARFPFQIEPRGAHQRNRLHLSFLDRSSLTSSPVPGVSGEVSWEPGRLTVHYPNAAGTGKEGPLVLEGPQEAGDSHAVSLVTPAGRSASWSGQSGVVVLRSQGLLEIQGALVRSESPQTDDVPSKWKGGDTLDGLLAYAKERELPWTFLIAGGDLVIPGDLDFDTPVILAAGGRTRISGSVVCRPLGQQLYLIGAGGGLGLEPGPRALPLRMPPPFLNPIRRAQTYGLVTSVLPNFALDRYAWESLEVRQDPGGGAVQVLFLPPTGPIDPAFGVPHPRSLPTDSPLRILVLLTLKPGGNWDPPVLDSIDLSWKSL